MLVILLPSVPALHLALHRNHPFPLPLWQMWLGLVTIVGAVGVVGYYHAMAQLKRTQVTLTEEGITATVFGRVMKTPFAEIKKFKTSRKKDGRIVAIEFYSGRRKVYIFGMEKLDELERTIRMRIETPTKRGQSTFGPER